MSAAAQSFLPAAEAECHETGPDDFRPLMGAVGEVAGIFPAKKVPF
jgi:hypothetical protein